MDSRYAYLKYCKDNNLLPKSSGIIGTEGRILKRK